MYVFFIINNRQNERYREYIDVGVGRKGKTDGSVSHTLGFEGNWDT